MTDIELDAFRVAWTNLIGGCFEMGVSLRASQIFEEGNGLPVESMRDNKP